MFSTVQYNLRPKNRILGATEDIIHFFEFHEIGVFKCREWKDEIFKNVLYHIISL